MHVKFELVTEKEKEGALIRSLEKTADIQNAIDLLENGSGGVPAISDGKMFFLKMNAIYYIESVDKRTYIYTKDGCFESRDRLYELENVLNMYFIRCAKATIVNLRKIKNVTSENGGRMIASLLNDEKVVIARSYVKDIKQRLGL